MKRTSTLSLTCALTALWLGATVTPASAKPLEQEHFHEVSSVVVEDFCGLTVRIDDDVSGTFQLNSRGSDQLAYASHIHHGTQSFTNLATDKTFTIVRRVNEKDLKVTDNGDGTLTLLVLATGSVKVYGPDGELLFNDPGQIRFELLIDNAGTPTDPFDDAFLEFLGVVKEDTGRHDVEGRDFCEDLRSFTA